MGSLSEQVAILKEAKRKIDECYDSDKLTKWEEDFILSVQEQINTKGFISERQEEILDRIYEKV